MSTIELISWNVNGLRAVHKKGFLDWVHKQQPELLCLQETKAHPDQLPPALLEVDGYRSYFSSATKKGYSGVALYTKIEPRSVGHGLGIPEFDDEGRTLIASYDAFTLYTIYFPNGKASPERLRYKLAFYDALLDHAEQEKKRNKHIIICGDVNTAHQEIDLARPKENETVSGFLPEERAWIDRLLDHGYRDSFRMFCPDPQQYTWWDYKTRARDRNVGWRLDYIFVSASLEKRVRSASILSDVMGSDHCPVCLSLG